MRKQTTYGLDAYWEEDADGNITYHPYTCANHSEYWYT